MNDLRFAFRQLLRSRGFTGIALLTLALGIGLNTSMFSLMNLLILKPLPYAESDRLMRIHRTHPQDASASHSASDFLELLRESADFAQLGAFRTWAYTLTPEGRPTVNANAIRVSAGFFPALGLKPLHGRWFHADEDAPGNTVAILGYEIWQAQFGGDPSVIDQSILIDSQTTTVIGVMPPNFTSVFLWGPTDVIRPLALTTEDKQKLSEAELALIARRAPNLTLEQFNARLATIANQLKESRPLNRAHDGLHAVSLTSAARNPATMTVSWLMVGLAGFVLLIACANLANLQLARAVARSHEFAIRAALGASHARLLRPLLAESLLLSLGGGLLGILLAVWANDWISSRLSAQGLFHLKLALDWRVFAFTIGLSALTAILFGLVPASRVSRVRSNDALKTGSRGNTGDRAQNRLQQSLIVSQFANALILLTCAVGFSRGVDQLVNPAPGWEQDKLVQAVLKLPDAKYTTPEQSYAFYMRLEEELRTLPGAENATVAWTLPVFQYLTSRSLVAQGQPPVPAGHEPIAYVNGVSSSYLPTLGIKVQSGRNFTESDGADAVPVAIINASLASALFPGEDPVGRRIGSPDPAGPEWIEIVGVVPDVDRSVGAVPAASRFLVLRPLAQETWNYVTVAVRSRQPAILAEPMRQLIAAREPELAIQQSGTIDQVTLLLTGSAKMLSSVLLGFAFLGIFLAALGIYGVISRVVVRRTPEIGVRVALGAQPGDVVGMILYSGLRMALLGTGIGLVGAFGLGFAIQKVAPGATATEPVLVLGVTLLLIAIGLFACWLPSRRAARIDPLTALRWE